MLKIASCAIFCLLAFTGEAAAQSCTGGNWTALQDGNVADANQVMGDFTCVLSSPVFSGSVGIGGTPFPGYSLEVDNPANATMSLNSVGQRQWWISAIKSGSDANLVIGTGPSYNNPDFTIMASSGYVGINQSNPSYPLQISGPNGAAGAVDIIGPDSTLYSNYWGPNTGGTITASAGGGSCTYSGGSGWSCSSDERLKTHISTLRSASGLTSIGRLHPVSYDLKRNRAAGSQMGFLAQEVRAVFPQAVSFDKNAKTQSASNGTYLLNYTALIPPAVLAIQQLNARTATDHQELRNLRAANDAQAAEIRSLRTQLVQLEKKVAAKAAAN